MQGRRSDDVKYAVCSTGLIATYGPVDNAFAGRHLFVQLRLTSALRAQGDESFLVMQLLIKSRITNRGAAIFFKNT